MLEFVTVTCLPTYQTNIYYSIYALSFLPIPSCGLDMNLNQYEKNLCSNLANTQTIYGKPTQISLTCHVYE
jgi:hypothetical protein